MVSLAVAVLGAPVEGKAVVKAHAVLAHQLPVEVSEAERGQLFAGERQVRSLENLTQNCFYLADVCKVAGLVCIYKPCMYSNGHGRGVSSSKEPW